MTWAIQVGVAGLVEPGQVADFSQLIAALQLADGHFGKQAVRAVNTGLTLRNWYFGLYIDQFELRGADRASYGDQLLQSLGTTLTACGIRNANHRQLYLYRAFYRAYPALGQRPAAAAGPTAALGFGGDLEAQGSAGPISLTLSAKSSPPQVGLATQLSYSHFEMLAALPSDDHRRYYETEAIAGQWSVRDLRRQISSLLYERTALSTDQVALRAETATGLSGQPMLTFRDPYVFEFLGLAPAEVMTESRLEQALADKLQALLLELGRGFCFEARQRRILIGGEHFFVDLVFYHRILKCHVLVELKVDEFKHEYIGQLNTYVSWYRKHEMQEGDQPPIGLLLCTRKNHALVEYALAGMDNQLFVARYQVGLPRKEELQALFEQALSDIAQHEAP